MKKHYLLFGIIYLFYSLNSFGFQSKSVSAHEEWSDTIHVIGNITIAQGGDLLIKPGCYIEFQGAYSISVSQNGKIRALGTNSQKITFTLKTAMSRWTGINFDNMASADSSIFEYCKIRLSIGAISIKNFNKIRISNCDISDNVQISELDRNGSGVYCNKSNIKIDSCIFAHNYALCGGGVYCWSSNVIITNSVFRANKVYDEGGALYTEKSTVTLVSCLIDSNYHENTGGGAGIGSNLSDLTLINCRVINNTKSAIYSYNVGGKLKIYNSVISNNVGNNVGGIECLGVEVIIANSTITNNKTNRGVTSGGIYIYYCGDVKIYNCILWNNGGSSSDIYYEGRAPKVVNCDIKFDNSFGLPDSLYVNNISLDPKFVNPSKVIGVYSDAYTSDWTLKSCSPCINRGNRSLLDTLLSTDLNNQQRIYSDTIDLGAVEFQSAKTSLLGKKIVYVKENGNGDGRSWLNAKGDIQSAINTNQDCYNGIEVWVAKGMIQLDCMIQEKLQ